LSQELDRQEITIRYLLGDLTEAERSRFEEQYFLDDKEFESLEIAEDELIDKYVREELSAEDTRRFKKLLVSPGLSERVEVARLLVKQTAHAPQADPVTPAIVPVKPPHVGWWDRLFGPAAAIPAFRPAFAMSLIFMLLTTAALVLVWTKLQSESQRLAQEQQKREALREQVEQEQAAATAAEHERQIAELRKRPGSGFTVSTILNPSSISRGPGGRAIEDVRITRGATHVGLKLNVTHGEDEYISYNASVRKMDSDDSDKSLAAQNNLRPFSEGGKKYITFKVNATRLRAGTYNVDVQGVTASGEKADFDDYPFRVRSR
jgi:hypothetical protein